MLDSCCEFGVLENFRTRILMFKAVLFVCSLLVIGASGEVTHPAEVRALRAFKKSLIDPHQNLSNWNRGDPCTSNWTGVLCFNTTTNDSYLHVKELVLLNMNLSGRLSSELGHFSYMKILNVMWNNIIGTIPKEIGNMTSLELLLLNGNQLTGSLPDEIGYLTNLNRIQIDQNQISGSIPTSFANLHKARHFHMNNNSISGQIPPELSKLPSLVHLLLDNNNLSGHLPSELAEMPNLLILQLDNNHFDGSTIPSSYSNMSQLLKLSLRNCNLQGPIPDLSRISKLAYIDLSSNRLNGSIPPDQLSENITTIDLSNNNLTGTIPAYFSSFPRLQKMSLANNSLTGSVSSNIWQNKNLNGTNQLFLDFQNNRLSNISGTHELPPNVTVRLQGNPICSMLNIGHFCDARNKNGSNTQNTTNSTINCPSLACPPSYEYTPASCICAAPLLVGYRLKSPGFSDFLPYSYPFQVLLASGLKLHLNQLDIDSLEWQEGPRLRMHLKIFPSFIDNSPHTFNRSEVLRIRNIFLRWIIRESEVFGPYEVLYFTLLDPYKDVIPTTSKSGISKSVLVGIILAAIAGVTLSFVVSLVILRLNMRKHHTASKRRQLSKISIQIDGVKSFSHVELARATSNFSSSNLVGRGGYGNVYKGVLANGTVVAIKREHGGTLQGEKEFLTEIQLLSRLHHRNLVPLVGYCDEEGDQILVYEFMSHGTLRDHLSGKHKEHLTFAMRLKISLGSAKGILYLHTEADPPIFHRDIKASNILLDSKYTAKVSDFGLSRLAPMPDIEGGVPAYVSTVVKGTPGYLDPEYLLTHKLTDKSDVYSLGVVFLELLTGMHPIAHGKNIVREVNIAYQSGMMFSVIDERMGSYPSDCMDKFMILALKCCKDETDARPSMGEVVRELEAIWALMPDANAQTTELMITDSENILVQSSSSTIENPYASTDVSGSDLTSGVIPSIASR